MKTIVLVGCLMLCLIPSVALGENKLNFKDKTSICGDYSLRGDKYCKSIGGGDICWNKADIASVEKVDECEGGGYATGGASSSTSANNDHTDRSKEEHHKDSRTAAQKEQDRKGEEYLNSLPWNNHAADKASQAASAEKSRKEREEYIRVQKEMYRKQQTQQN